jgi:hypothetical protein
MSQTETKIGQKTKKLPLIRQFVKNFIKFSIFVI